MRYLHYSSLSLSFFFLILNLFFFLPPSFLPPCYRWHLLFLSPSLLLTNSSISFAIFRIIFRFLFLIRPLSFISLLHFKFHILSYSSYPTSTNFEMRLHSKAIRVDAKLNFYFRTVNQVWNLWISEVFFWICHPKKIYEIWLTPKLIHSTEKNSTSRPLYWYYY